jgi:enoyl-CoA hydratase
MEETSETILYEKRDRVAIITLNRADKRNAMNAALVNALKSAWIDFESDPDMRVAILTGTGKAFCTGMDLEETSRGIRTDLNACIPNYGVEVTKPIIGAINGWAIGAGMGLAYACDIKVIAEGAKFIFPEAKVGYAVGGVDLLKYLPYSIAMEILLTGEPFDAKRAYEVGFVNRVVSDGELMNEAMKFANIIRENAPLTMKMLKMFAVQHTQTVKSAWLMMETRYIKPQIESQDFKEGMLAFKEKRKPIFKGK